MRLSRRFLCLGGGCSYEEGSEGFEIGQGMAGQGLRGVDLFTPRNV